MTQAIPQIPGAALRGPCLPCPQQMLLEQPLADHSDLCLEEVMLCTLPSSAPVLQGADKTSNQQNSELSGFIFWSPEVPPALGCGDEVGSCMHVGHPWKLPDSYGHCNIK